MRTIAVFESITSALPELIFFEPSRNDSLVIQLLKTAGHSLAPVNPASANLVLRQRLSPAGVHVLRNVPNIGDPYLAYLERPYGTGFRGNRVQKNAGRFVVQYLSQLLRR